MAFNELDLKRIDKVIGEFCRRRARPEFADQLHLDYRIEGQSVVIYEDRPDWRDATKRMQSPVAKLRFVRASGLWTLYWRRANLRWYRYHPAASTPDLARLVEVVDGDEYGAFFG